MSTINAIMQPFSFKSTSTQTFGKTSAGNNYRIRSGKTVKDKANGHVAYRKNRRVWIEERTAQSNGYWAKVF